MVVRRAIEIVKEPEGMYVVRRPTPAIDTGQELADIRARQLARISKQEREYLQATEAFEKGKIYVEGKGWVWEQDWGELEPAAQEAFKRGGSEGLSAYYAGLPGISVPGADTIQLRTGEYVSKTEYNELSSEDKELINVIGIEEYNSELQKRALEIGTTNVELDTGEYVPTEDYDAMSVEAQTKLNELGVEKFNIWVEETNARITEIKEILTPYETEEGLYSFTSEDVDKLGEDLLLEAGFTQEDINAFKYPVTIEAGGRVYEGTSPGVIVEAEPSFVLAPTEKEIIASMLPEYRAGAPPTKEEYLAIEGYEGISPIAAPTSILAMIIGVPGWISSHLPFGSAREQKEAWEKYMQVSGGMTASALSSFPDYFKSAMPGITTERERLVQEWQEEYGITEPTYGAAGTWGEEAGIPIMRVVYPQIEWAEITPLEKIISGVNIVALTSPLWVPPITRGLVRGFEYIKPGLREFIMGERGGFRVPGMAGVELKPIELKPPTRVATKTIPIDWRKLISESKPPKPAVDWRVIEQAVKAGEARIAAQAAARTAAEAAKVRALGRTYSQRYLAEQAARVTGRGPLTAAEIAEMQAKVAASRAKIAPIVAPEVSTVRSFAGATWGMQRAPVYRFVSPSVVSAPGISQLLLPTTVLAAMAGLGVRNYKVVSAKTVTQLKLTTQQIVGLQSLTAAQIKTLAQVSGLTETQVKTLVKTGTLVSILPATATQIEAALKTLTKTEPALARAVATKLQPATAMEAKVTAKAAVEAKIKPAIETKVMPATAAEVQAAVKTRVEPAISTMTKLSPALQTILRVEPAVQAATEAAVKTITETQTLTKIISPQPTVAREMRVGREYKRGRGRLRIPRKETIEELELREFPPGTIVWRQGIFWKAIPPPYEDIKPISMKEAPIGADTSGRTPKETIQIIGGPAPLTALVDLGVVDIMVKGGTEEIEFVGHGMLTDVGKRHPSTGIGMSVVVEEELPYSRPRSRSRKNGRTREMVPSIAGLKTVR